MISVEGCTWVPTGVKGQMWKWIRTGTPLAVDQPASLSSLTLSTHATTAPAEVTATSLLPYADTLHFPLNYGKNSDARCIWVPSRRTRNTSKLQIYLSEGRMKIHDWFLFSVACDSQTSTTYLWISFYYAAKQTTSKNSSRILIGSSVNCVKTWRWEPPALLCSRLQSQKQPIKNKNSLF